MLFGLDVPTTGEYADPRALARLAAAAEASGWDGFFVWDVLDGADPWIALTAIALHTERMRIGTMVLALARHQPWLVAKRFAELDHLSGGRVVCAVGLGYRDEDFSAFGAEPDRRLRADRLDEGLMLLDRLWTETDVSHRGRHYTLEGVTVTPRPLQSPRIPLWIAGGWPRRPPFRRAAKWDGVCFMAINAETREWLSVEEFQAGVAYVRQHRAAQGPFDIIASGETSGDREAAIAKVQAFGSAGATWWVEEGLGWSLDEFREHIRRGPPRGEEAPMGAALL
ncbi:MAG TPA: LLM class flavin-dependent oxidoreductase [Roseiflexaceae bacterium]|nr:LLM class flavin-dependent oxidoreductase [Roseiflexaceae bacterium]